MAQDGAAMPRAAEFLERFDHHSPDYPVVMDEAIQLMHQRCPVLRTDAWGGYVVVSKFRDVLEAARNPTVFSSKDGLNIPPARPELELLQDMEPPRNTRYRAMFGHVLSPAAMEAQRPAIRNLAFSLVEAKRASGRLDVVRDVAQPIAGIATFRVMGFDTIHWRTFAEPLHNFFYGVGPLAEALAAVQALDSALLDLIAEARRAPRPGTILQALFEGDIDGRKLDDREIGGIASNIIGGGLDSTQALTGHALVHLGRHPEARRRLVDDETQIPAAVEEFLRMHAPLQGSARTVTQDYVLGGASLKAGERVFLHWAAASRDPDQHACPYQVDLDREHVGHAAFGLGAHLCPGAHLARVEVRSTIEAILTLAPDFELVESDLRLAKDMGVVFGYDAVPIRFPARVSHTGVT